LPGPGAGFPGAGRDGLLSGSGDDTRYAVTCFHCGISFDAGSSPWCECITDNPTLVCSHCGKCFCGSDTAFKRSFWADAPPGLWRRRLAKQFRGTPLPPLEEGNPIRRPLVLVVDDNEDTRLVAYRVIESLGYGVVLARDGVEAFGLARRFHPDLILTDQVMPRMGGKELCRLIKADSELSAVKVILMTGLYRKDRQRIEFMRESGADDFLTKPIGFEKLGDVLAGWLQSENRDS